MVRSFTLVEIEELLDPSVHHRAAGWGVVVAPAQSIHGTPSSCACGGACD
jgi:hypothetical protein